MLFVGNVWYSGDMPRYSFCAITIFTDDKSPLNFSYIKHESMAGHLLPEWTG